MMKLFTLIENLTSTVLWKYCLMIFVIAILTTSVGWARSSQLETLGVEEIEDPRPFITIWKTDNPGSSDDNQITIPTDPSVDLALVYNYDIYWEDVNDANINGVVSGLTGDHTIDFPAAGTYRVEITGEFPKMFFNRGGDKSKIISVEQWGDIVWEDMQYSFYGCDNIAINASDAPDLSVVTNMRGMFRASSINQDVNHWDVSMVKDMSQLFRDAITFNQTLSNWNVGNVLTMGQMFMDAEVFNQDIGNWDVSGAANLAGMFSGATNFNQDISGWDVSNVERMDNMFSRTSSFNQDISSWDVSNVTDMGYMFRFAINFNQPIGSWDVRNVAQFSRMFQNATNFNSNLDHWKIESATDLSLMFMGALSFNQDLSLWDISNVTNISGMLRDCGLSPYNYDALLQGWLANGVQDGLTLDVNGLSYCQGEAARDELISEYGWTFTGDNKDCSQIITFDALPAKTFGDPDFKLEGKVTSGAPIIYTSLDEDVAIISGDSIKIIGVGTTTIIASQPGNGYYSAATPINRELKINKANQTIAFEPIPEKTIGDDAFDLVATTASGLEITFTSADESVAEVEGNTVTIIGPGTVVITAFQEGSGNYHAADPVEQILQVKKKPQSIVFEPIPSKTILDDEFDLTAVASSGLDVVYSSSDEAVATVYNGKVSIKGIGETMIIASQPGNEEYEAAEDVSIKLSITKVPQEITFEPITDKLADEPDFEIVASSSSGLPITFTINGPATIEGSSISLRGTPGIVSVTATQVGDDIYSPAEAVIRTFEVLAVPVTGVQYLRKEGISIYPNPIYDRLIIELAKNSRAVVYVSDTGGNIVLEDRLVGASNHVDVSSLSSGLYFIKIQLEDKVLYHKVVKE